MAFVSVPKDLTKVKNKIIFNLTKRQLICFVIAAAVGLPFFFLSRGRHIPVAALLEPMIPLLKK